MDDQQEIIKESGQVTAEDNQIEESQGVKVYERPARPLIPIWLLILLIIMALALSWFVYQALR